MGRRVGSCYCWLLELTRINVLAAHRSGRTLRLRRAVRTVCRMNSRGVESVHPLLGMALLHCPDTAQKEEVDPTFHVGRKMPLKMFVTVAADKASERGVGMRTWERFMLSTMWCVTAIICFGLVAYAIALPRFQVTKLSDESWTINDHFTSEIFICTLVKKIYGCVRINPSNSRVVEFDK